MARKQSLDNSLRTAFILPVLLLSTYCQPAAGAPSARRLVATRVTTPPIIDGNPDDACWQEAAQATGFSVFTNADQLHPQPTQGRVCFDADSIYVFLTCHVKEMEKFRSRLAQSGTDFDYWKGGVVEIFFDLNHDRKTYQQYLFHANGSSFVALPSDDLLKILNQDFITSKSVVTETGYNIEVAIPLAMLHLRPDTARIWGFNLNRFHDAYGETMAQDVQFSSWNSTRGANFPTPGRFGDLLADAELSRFYWRVDFVREPQPGDKTISVRTENQTGRDFSGRLTLSITRPDGREANLEERLELEADQAKDVVLDHAVSTQDAEARYKISLSDSSGRVCYLGGTETRDLTPGDDWRPPPPTDQQTNDGYLLFARPYTEPVLYKAVPESEEIVSSLSISACRGEFEPVTFSIYPLTDIESLEVTASGLQGPDGSSIPASAIDIRKVTYQSVWKNIRAFTAVEHLLRTFDILNLTEGRTQRLWLTARIPDDAAPGRYSGTVSLDTGESQARLPLNVRVLPFELSEPDEMAYFMYFPGVGHRIYSNEDFFRKIAADHRDHGMSSFTIYNTHYWKDEDSQEPSLHLDTRYPGYLHHAPYGVSYAKMIEILQEAGIGSRVPLLEITNMSPSTRQVKELYEVYQERNWPQVAFYIGDEIDFPERIEAARRPLEALKREAPNIKTATALGAIGKEALGHMYDIWVGCSAPEDVKECLALGKAPWTYSCRQTHEIGPAFVRHFFGRHPFKVGLKGVGLWAYTHDEVFFDRYVQLIKYSEDLVFTPDMTQIHGHIYCEDNRIIPLVTWEAVREGIDDYRYMLTLKKIAESALAGAEESERTAGEAGMKVLREITDGINPAYALDDKKYGRQWQVFDDMDGFRAEIIEAILAIDKCR